MKARFFFLLVLILPFFGAAQLSPADSTRRKIALFAPLYLDSAFNELDEYRYGRLEFPKFINPGLEFYEGAHLALDSLGKEGAPLEVFVYDTRSARQSLADQLRKAEYDRVELMIVHCNANEIRLFAEAAQRMKVPVINANLPNDGGTTANPFLVLLNPTLRTHCEGLYEFIPRQYAKSRLVVFRKKGTLEDRIRGYFDDYARQSNLSPLKFKYVDLPDSFTMKDLQPHLDTVQHTLCVAGSLDENFGRRLVLQLAGLRKQKYQATVMGMPTWDNIRDFAKPEYRGIEILYSNPFYNAKTDKVSENLSATFNRILFARPSDMVFRGFETTYRFARLLLEYGNDLSSNLGNKTSPLFTAFDIQPVVNRQNLGLEYFENKKLYLVKWLDGLIKAVY